MTKILTCLCLVTVLYSCKSPSAGSPRHTVSAFIEASKAGNIIELKKYITRSDVSLLEMGENFLARLDPDGARNMKDKMANEFKAKTKDARIEVKEEKISGDNATVNVAFFQDGKTENRPFNLVKEDGKWKISLLSTGMKNAGSDKQEVEKAMQDINMDSLSGAISEGLKEFNKLNKDSLKAVIDAGMKDLEKLKDTL